MTQQSAAVTTWVNTTILWDCLWSCDRNAEENTRRVSTPPCGTPAMNKEQGNSVLVSKSKGGNCQHGEINKSLLMVLRAYCLNNKLSWLLPMSTYSIGIREEVWSLDLFLYSSRKSTASILETHEWPEQVREEECSVIPVLVVSAAMFNQQKGSGRVWKRPHWIYRWVSTKEDFVQVSGKGYKFWVRQKIFGNCISFLASQARKLDHSPK